MLILIGKFTAKPEKKQELIELAHKLFSPSRSEPGCISYQFYEDTEVENAFVFLEKWDSEAALERHFETRHFTEFAQKFADSIVGEPDVKTFEVQSVKELFKS